MTVKAFIALGMITASAVIVFGCTSSERAGSLAGAAMQSLTAQRTQVGVVIKLREISLVDDRTLLNARAETQGRSIAQVGGAVLSAMTDESTDDHSVETNAQEITVRVESGAINVVTQTKTENLQLNQRVKIINAQQNTRVVAY